MSAQKVDEIVGRELIFAVRPQRGHSFLAHPGVTRLFRHCWTVLGVAFSTAPLGAQIAGDVQSSGVPLPNATVVLWGATHELARTTTDAQGRFRFDSVVAARASGLVARSIGYEPSAIAVRTGDEGLRITLTQRTQSLPATVVSVTRRQCPFRDEPAARALWMAVRDTYVTASPTVGHLAVMAWRHGDVAGAEVGDIDEARIGPGSYGVTGTARGQYESTMATRGYAVRRRASRAGETVIDPAYFAWWYPPLHRAMLEHFVGTTFAQRHVFRLGPSSGTLGRQLLFCPRDRKQPALEGAMELAPDSSVARVRWLFVTPKPREDAGGEVVLVPPGSSTVRRLVPTRSVYWRRLAGYGDRYYQDEATYQGWYWGITESIPRQPGAAR